MLPVSPAKSPHHALTLFTGGITGLSCVSGKEHKDICRILLGLVIDLPLPDGQGVTDGLSVLCLESTLLESPWYVKAKLTYSEVRSDR